MRFVLTAAICSLLFPGLAVAEKPASSPNSPTWQSESAGPARPGSLEAAALCSL